MKPMGFFMQRDPHHCSLLFPSSASVLFPWGCARCLGLGLPWCPRLLCSWLGWWDRTGCQPLPFCPVTVLWHRDWEQQNLYVCVGCGFFSPKNWRCDVVSGSKLSLSNICLKGELCFPTHVCSCPWCLSGRSSQTSLKVVHLHSQFE